MIIDSRGLTREFSRRSGPLRARRTAVRAVDEISFAVAPGESVGYIGANGAGNSTTIKMLTGILTPTVGTVRTCGLDPQRRDASPADRGRVRPALPALVGPAVGRVPEHPGRDPPPAANPLDHPAATS